MDVNVDANENKRKHDEPNLQGDKLNIVLLIFMYTLQFIPRGLILAIPLILQKRKATYTNQVRNSDIKYYLSFSIPVHETRAVIFFRLNSASFLILLV